MKNIRFLLLFLTVQIGLPDVKAQFICNQWLYQIFEEWNAHEDTIVGKYIEKNGYYFFIAKDYVVSVNGREYMGCWQYPMPMPMNGGQETQPKKVVPPRERSRYSIGVRFENGRVLTDYEDFKFYQSCHIVYDNFHFFLFSHGNPDYLPYNLTEDGKELILYDYTMEVGDSYRHVDGYDDISVAKKDTVWLSGDPDTPRRRLTLTNGLVLIEGVGCINSNGMLLDYLNPESQYASRYTYLVQCTTHTGDVIYYDYRKDSGMNIFDQNTLGITETSPRHSSSSACYDLQGRLLSGTPRKGLYIRDGKKAVRK